MIVQCNTVANACTTAILEASKFDEGDRNQGNSDEQLGNVLQVNVE